MPRERERTDGPQRRAALILTARYELCWTNVAACELARAVDGEQLAMQGRLQWCSAERNEGTAAIERWARAVGKDAYMETVRRFNCTGTDGIEHPAVLLRPKRFRHLPTHPAAQPSRAAVTIMGMAALPIGRAAGGRQNPPWLETESMRAAAAEAEAEVCEP